MKVAIGCAGIGAAATGDFIRRSAQAAERHGFSSYWLPEHVVRFGAYPESTHPYAAMFGGSTSMSDARVPFLDPIVGMAWAAAATSTIEIGSAIIILPQRNPVVLAKELVSLDQCSGGRIALGAGVGWCKEEYDAIGADWAGRGRRMDEHIAVLRTLWDKDEAAFQGETISFANAFMYPKPVRKGGIPIILGGESDASLRRIARMGDGWLGLNVPVEQAHDRIAMLKRLTREQDRDPEALRIMCPIFETTRLDTLERYRDAGATEYYLLASGAETIDEQSLDARLAELAGRFVETVRRW
jgi:probable F420-dependent oxidoreductase